MNRKTSKVTVKLCLPKGQRNLVNDEKLAEQRGTRAIFFYPFSMVELDIENMDGNVSDIQVPVSAVSTRELFQDEIQAKGCDFWDDREKFEDKLTGKTFLVSNSSYNRDSHLCFFYLKDFKTKKVYICTVDLSS